MHSTISYQPVVPIGVTPVTRGVAMDFIRPRAMKRPSLQRPLLTTQTLATSPAPAITLPAAVVLPRPIHSIERLSEQQKQLLKQRMLAMQAPATSMATDKQRLAVTISAATVAFTATYAVLNAIVFG